MEMEVGSILLQEIRKGQMEDKKIQEIKRNIKEEKSSGMVWREMLPSMLHFATLVSKLSLNINDLVDSCSHWKWEEIAMDFIVGLPRT
jgi:hypothetical protein